MCFGIVEGERRGREAGMCACEKCRGSELNSADVGRLCPVRLQK